MQNGNFSVNGIQYTSPSVPVLLQLMSGADTAASLMPSGSVFVLPTNASIEVSFPISGAGAAGAPHPFHLHGVCLSTLPSAHAID